ncbi:maleylpyruvate isomerase family protein [Rhodocytophaga rosea]|uniref:Maleylpyruvate isomerase family protein n=1 Tax=Rhodocytophaga rosea TaxID=2704465 RepID=A0A6C0GSC1_9BACT|nr:maleylpyruvate isomerase N-terminal domain-containing protein [Rhodocytophaga rosea]QHT70370.1 maleylpyruvate isomerase family protein [Rhodocytophaga rosea]
MQKAGPIFTLDLFPVIDRKLTEVLRSLCREDWEKQTIAPLWKVKDIAAHLLDGNIRGVSMSRDNYFGVSPGEIHSYQDLVGFLNKLNADWVQAAKRISPELMISLLDLTANAYYEHARTLDPFGEAIFSVGWAGEQTSPNWFHIAREYTEKWHHQQQVRLAVGQEAELLQTPLYFPFLDTSMRALPYHYRSVAGQKDEVIQFTVSGGNGSWYLWHNGETWELLTSCTIPPVCEILLDKEKAWQIFTKGLKADQARPYVQIQGKQTYGEHIFHMLAVMA